ncbi:hypothetical protein LDENG_00131200, partial [Lucifuga dentata]
YQLHNISKLRSVVLHSVFETIIHVFISSRLDYCNSLFTCLNKSLLGKLQLVQNAAARPLYQTRAFHSQAPDYICELLMPYSTGRTLRPSEQGLLTIFWSKLKMRDDCDFVVLGSSLWNSLPNNIRLAETVGSFKQLLKMFLTEFVCLFWLCVCLYSIFFYCEALCVCGS